MCFFRFSRMIINNRVLFGEGTKRVSVDPKKWNLCITFFLINKNISFFVFVMVVLEEIGRN